MSGWRNFTEYQEGFTGPLLTAPGSVFGVRWWLVKADGNRVSGAMSYWTGPEQTAECLASCNRMLAHYSSVTGMATISVAAELPEHRPPGDDCPCGFYAYWDTADRAPALSCPAGFTLVVGVIEGFGKTLIGDQGFRCEKARICGVAAVQTWVEALPDFAVRPDRGEYVLHLAPVSVMAVTDHALVARVFDDGWGVPVYRTQEEVLAAHPLTTDYRRLVLPPASRQAPEPGEGSTNPVHP